MLSHGLWTRRFGGDRGIIGRRLVLNGSARTVVAVMPAAFNWPVITGSPSRLPGPELWIPGTVGDVPRTPVDQPNLAANRTAGYLRAVVRLKDGVTLDQARQEAQAIAARLAQQYPAEDGGRGATLVPLTTQFVGHLRQPMLILFGAVGFVLAIACANIASLLLGRGAARRREFAVRAALGASRARVIRQLLTESIVLASAGAAVGAVVAWWSLRWLMRISPGDLPGIETVALDGRVLLFTVLLSLVTGVVCGLAPALHASVGSINADLGETSGRGSEGRRTGRTRDALVALEIAVALVLLVGAGLLLRSFHSLSRVDTGIRTANLLTFDMALTGERAQSPQSRRAFYDRALHAIAALPGVESAGAAATLPIGGDDFASGVTIEGKPQPRPGEQPRAGLQVVTPGYFRTMGIRVVDGRDVADSDTPEARPVVLVNETFARQHWPGEPAVGRRIRLGGAAGDWFTVVGVVSDIRHLGPATPPRPEFYQPYTQRSFPFMAFVVRTSGSPTALVPSIRAAVTNLDRAQPISGVSTMEEHIARALSRPRFMSTLIGCFGFLALVLSTGRRVRRHGLLGHAAHARDRHSHGARGDRPRRAHAGGGQGDLARGCGRRWRPRRIARTVGRAAGTALRRYCGGSGHIRRRRGPAHSRCRYWPRRYRPGVPCGFRGRPSSGEIDRSRATCYGCWVLRARRATCDVLRARATCSSTRVRWHVERARRTSHVSEHVARARCTVARSEHVAPSTRST